MEKGKGAVDVVEIDLVAPGNQAGGCMRLEGDVSILRYQFYLPSSPFIRSEGSKEICCLAALILCFSPLPLSLNLPMSGAS